MRFGILAHRWLRELNSVPHPVRVAPPKHFGLPSSLVLRDEEVCEGIFTAPKIARYTGQDDASARPMDQIYVSEQGVNRPDFRPSV